MYVLGTNIGQAEWLLDSDVDQVLAFIALALVGSHTHSRAPNINGLRIPMATFKRIIEPALN
jgi:hypothetical protein